MNKLSLTVCVLLCCGAGLYSIDHINGSPWNIDISGSVQAASNSNVFYDEEDAASDTIIHVIPGLRVEYEKLENVLFEGELTIDSHTYLDNSDADIIETTLHVQVKPVRAGAYMIFSEDYKLFQNYSATGGLVETGVNYLTLGGGYRGYHLDVSGKGVFESTTYSDYQDLDYTFTGAQGDLEYLFESFYLLGRLEGGSLSYSGDQMNDGTRFLVSAGIGKRFYPKSMVELRAGLLSQSHEDDGEDFQGLVYSVAGKHITTSGRSSFRMSVAKKVIPSSFAEEDYTETLTIQYQSKHNITTRIMADIAIRHETDTIGEDRTDNVLEIEIKGSYTPMDMLPLRYIRRKRRKPSRTHRTRIKIDAGIRSRSRTSDVSEYEFDQMVVFAGVTVVY